MKTFVCTKNDWDYNVIDVFLIIEYDGETIDCHLKGFDDHEWKQAEDFANSIAKALCCIFIGDKTDT